MSKLSKLVFGTLVTAITSFAGVILAPLDPVLVDTTFVSDTGELAMIRFVNQSSVAVDVYWIDFVGDRLLYQADLAPGTSYDQLTYLTHPWLVTVAGTGTAAEGTGTLVAAFLPVTSNPTWDSANADIAYITPEPSAWMLLGSGALALLALRPRSASSSADRR